MKVMRDNPATLALAVNGAMQEQNFCTRFNLRTGKNTDRTDRVPQNSYPEPIEVDYLRRCYRCHKNCHI